MGRAVNWTKEYKIVKKPKYAFEEDDEYEIEIIGDEADGTSYAYNRITRIQKLLEKYAGKTIPYDASFYNTPEEAEATLIEPKTLVEMFDKVLKNIDPDSEDWGHIEYFRNLAKRGFYIIIDCE